MAQKLSRPQAIPNFFKFRPTLSVFKLVRVRFGSLKAKMTNFKLIKRSSILKVNSKWVKGYHINRELHKHLNFYDKSDLEDQGQGH